MLEILWLVLIDLLAQTVEVRISSLPLFGVAFPRKASSHDCNITGTITTAEISSRI